MAMSGHSPHEGPATRHVRFKQILFVDRDEDWGLPIRETLAASPYLCRVAVENGSAVEAIRRGEFDLVIISSFVGDQTLQLLHRELEALATPPPVLLLAYLHGESRWEEWRSLPCVSIVRTPFSPTDVLDAVRALIGEAWEETRGGGEALSS